MCCALPFRLTYFRPITTTFIYINKVSLQDVTVCHRVRVSSNVEVEEADSC